MNNVALVGRVHRPPTLTCAGDHGRPATTVIVVVEAPGREEGLGPVYVPCCAYGPLADAVACLTRGDLISLQGQLGWQHRRDTTGHAVIVLVVLVRELHVLTPADMEVPPYAPET